MVKTYKIKVKTNGNCHVVNITDDVQSAIEDSQLADGAVIIFNIGSTAGLTTLEFEPGLVKHDMAALFERLAPQNARYEHEETWHDDNGHSHCRASLLGPSLNVPVVDGALTLGTWQQIVLIDFDTRERTRTIVCQRMGA